MQDDSSQPNTTIKFIRYQPAARWLYAVFFGIATIIAITWMLPFTVQIARQGSPGWFVFVSCALAIFVVLALGIRRLVWVIETRNEGLYIRHMLGNSEVIPWQQIRQISLLWGQGRPRLWISGDSRFGTRAQFEVSYSNKNGGKARVDDLLTVIASAAHLTQIQEVSRSRWGMRTYERESSKKE